MIFTKKEVSDDCVSKGKNEVNKIQEKYQVTLQDINNYNAKNMQEMINVFKQSKWRLQ